ncbi:replication initiation protein [Hymenobacter sp. IS2118]|uniref:replication initiation protein n=1 Tax=Hymenobacter sp. IS2118 TaxID=1505605 RepID=UPI000554C908|nr:replication initiation protein [Hymenobacter sp. IS2118]
MNNPPNPLLEVRQSNALTNARFEYSELQLDLFFFMLSKLRKTQESLVYQLNIKELSALTGKQYHLPYLLLATEGMMSRVFTITTEKSVKQLSMFQRIEYLTGTGITEIKLSEDILPHLFHLKDNFTSYGLAAALRLSSKYAKRIYQLCSQWKDLGETKKYDVQDLKKTLGLIDDKGNEKMKQFGQLRSFVLDPAVKQINEHTELHISYQLEKVGRSFKNIVFTVKPQALADTIPFDLVPGDTAPAGLAPHQVENAGRLLAQLSIITPTLVAQILGNAAHVAACNKFAHDLKTGKHTKTHSLSGLLLTILGLKKTGNGPLFNAQS